MSIPKQSEKGRLSRTTSSTQLSLPLTIKIDINISTRSRRSRINHLLLDITKGVVSFHFSMGMYRAREKNASSTLMFDFAEVSMNGMPSSWASALPCSSETTRFSVQSHLFPIRILWTPSVACCSTFWNHVRISAGKRVSNRFNIDTGLYY